MRRGFGLFLLLLCLLSLSACFDYRGMEDQIIVSGIAVDWKDEGYALTFEIVDVIGVENGQFGSILLTTTGETFALALSEAAEKLHREMYLGTLRVVLLGRSFAEEVGLMPIAAHLLYDKQVRNSLPIAVVDEEEASGLFAEEKEGRRLVSTELSETISGGRNRGSTMTLHEIYTALITDVREIILPLVGAAEAEGLPFALDGRVRFQDGRLQGR